MKPKKIMYAALVWLLATSLITVTTAAAEHLNKRELNVPPDLKNWRSWVLHGLDEQLCPTNYNDGLKHRCYWPSQLILTADDSGGHFEQTWMIFAKGSITLPGSPEIWPENVMMDQHPVPVMNRDNVPSIYAAPGLHTVNGVFHWKGIPETLMIPPDTGILKLTLNGVPTTKVADRQGRLWLQQRTAFADAEDRLQINVFRLMKDTIPFQMIHHIILNVSGREREIRVQDALLPGMIPLTIDSPLPVRLGKNCDILVQSRPGKWTIEITARFKGPVKNIGPAPCPYGKEIWSFDAKPDLRVVTVEDVPSVEPTRTDIPKSWQIFPAFLVEKGNTVIFKELRRGDTDPAPDRLTLFREFWLDFSGNGYTIQDNINGMMSTHCYLALNPPALLGRVSVDETDRLITIHGENQKPGVELRRGEIKLTADSRWEDEVSRVPAVGWDHDFDAVSGRLNLPPGWRLLTARGVDIIPGTWFQQWTLLDFFLMLIIGLGVMKLKGPGWGILALTTLILIYHEPLAPRLVWLHLIGATALLTVLPSGKMRRVVHLWKIGSVIVLLVLAIPFMVQQVRWGIFPQLENPGSFYGWGGLERMSVGTKLDSAVDTTTSLMPQKKERITRFYPASQQMQQLADARRKKAVVFSHDPNANIQTGPGLPSWKWRSVNMKWNGPVDRSQSIRLLLLSPSINMILSFIRLVLLAMLIYGLLNLKHWRKTTGLKFVTSTTAILLLILSFEVRAETSSIAYPPPEMLKELQTRLLEKPDCLPFCAACSKMNLQINDDQLSILLELHIAADTAVPLPGALKSWLPERVLLNETPAKGLARDKDGRLWMFAPEGVHRVLLTGPAGAGDEIRIPLPLRPSKIVTTSQNWEIQGVRPNGTTAPVIQLRRGKKREPNTTDTWSNEPPPFLHVIRTLHLGLTWSVSTTVNRMTKTGVPVVAAIPLIDGESVTTAGIDVEKQNALISMAANATEIHWTSTLDMTTEINLQVPQDSSWTETWILNASPIWHCKLSGIPVIHHQQEGVWRPTWRPWPGEQVIVSVSKPRALPGQIKTIDNARLECFPGKRFSKVELTLNMRTSHGGHHDIELAPKASLKLVKINDEIQPIRMENRSVLIPLQPGRQTIYLQWHEPAVPGILLKGPKVKVGEKAVNASIQLNMPGSSWILWAGGPRLGPAVLFWSYLLVVVLAALGLGRTTLAPLKTHQWLLLGLGLTQVSPLVALMIVGWLMALKARREYSPPKHWFYFNATQLLLALWTLAACIGFYMAIERGLIGIPEMQISGNNSTAFKLYWTQDRIQEYMPQPWVLYLPRLIYHLLMLFWALWIAVSLLKWFKWGWYCFSHGCAWKKASFRRKKSNTPSLLKTE